MRGPRLRATRGMPRHGGRHRTCAIAVRVSWLLSLRSGAGQFTGARIGEAVLVCRSRRPNESWLPCCKPIRRRGAEPTRPRKTGTPTSRSRPLLAPLSPHARVIAMTGRTIRALGPPPRAPCPLPVARPCRPLQRHRRPRACATGRMMSATAIARDAGNCHDSRLRIAAMARRPKRMLCHSCRAHRAIPKSPPERLARTRKCSRELRSPIDRRA